MKLEEMSMEELTTVEKKLAYDSKRMMDKHKAWEAQQKRKLLRAEIKRRRKPLNNLQRMLKKWFGN